MRIAFASLTLAVAAAANADMVVSQQNFESMTIGNLSGDTTGASTGQGGWYIFNSATAAGSGASDYQIVADPNPTNSNGGPAHNGGQVLRVQAGTTATGNNNTRFAWNDDTHNAMLSNPAENNLFVMTYDFYMDGGSATSTNRYGNYLYDATGTKILAGVTMQNSTGQFYIVGNYNNAGTIGNFSFSTGTNGVLQRNRWYTFAVTFDSATGRFQGGFSLDGGATFSMFYVDGAAAGTVVDEYDLIGSVNAGTAAQGTTWGFYDNISAYTTSTIPAPGAIALLGLAGLAGRRRR